MPTANVTRINTLHHFQLLKATFLGLLAFFHSAELPEKRSWLLGICLQRQMRLLHTLLLHIMGGIQRTDCLFKAMVQRGVENVKWITTKFDVAHKSLFCYIGWPFTLK